jgi:hypothetical protein
LTRVVRCLVRLERNLITIKNNLSNDIEEEKITKPCFAILKL